MNDYQLLITYSAHFPNELLQVELVQAGEEDLWLFFKGQVSSLMRTTPANEGISLWQAGVEIQRIDRLQAPYNPVQPVILAADVSLDQLRQRLGL